MRNIARLLAVTALLTSLIVLPALVFGAEADSSDAEYKALVNKVTSGDLSVDFRALRIACANTNTCNSRGGNEDIVAMRQAGQQRSHEEVAKIAGRLIETGFPNIEAHAARATAYAALGKSRDAEFHQKVFSLLLRSILDTGDGKTQETAFEVIGTHEERIVMMVLGLPPVGRQSLIAGKPHSYDVLEAEDPKTKKTVSVYFNIDAFYPMKGFR